MNPFMIVAAADTSVPAALSDLVTYVFSLIGDVVGTIVESPVLLIPVGLTLAGAAIGLAKSLMGTRRKKMK